MCDLLDPSEEIKPALRQKEVQTADEVSEAKQITE